MSPSVLTQVAIALVAIGFCHANPLPESAVDTITAEKHFGCTYEIIPNKTFSTHPFEPAQFGVFTANSSRLDKCAEFCDEKKDCVAALFSPHESGNEPSSVRCEAVIQNSFSAPKLAPSKTNQTVLQLQPRSCKKPVATVAPFPCKDGQVVTDHAGCKYKVSCDVELDKLNFSTYLTTKNAKECFNTMARMHHGYGFSFYAGGDCRINNSVKEKHAPTSPVKYPHTVKTVQIIKGSCNK